MSWAREGDIFEILIFVTDVTFKPGQTDALFFDRPIDAPGVRYVSRFVRLTVGQRGTQAYLVLLYPLNGMCVDPTVTFRWSIENRRSGQTYCSDVITDKGMNPFDGSSEDVFPAGTQTTIQVPLDPSRYNPASFEWGVRLTTCTDSGALCPCTGQVSTSQIWRLRTSAGGTNCP